jgi:hypothetical protein
LGVVDNNRFSPGRSLDSIRQGKLILYWQGLWIEGGQAPICNDSGSGDSDPFEHVSFVDCSQDGLDKVIASAGSRRWELASAYQAPGDNRPHGDLGATDVDS